MSDESSAMAAMLSLQFVGAPTVARPHRNTQNHTETELLTRMEEDEIGSDGKRRRRKKSTKQVFMQHLILREQTSSQKMGLNFVSHRSHS
jgi:hypothetical protein